MNAQEILAELKALGTKSTRQVFKKHGAPENHFGVKVEDLKKLQKKLKKNYILSLELYATGNADAQYLAGLIADEKSMTKEDLRKWANSALWYMQSEYTVPWIAAESKYGWELALEWINDPDERLQSSGWSTLTSIISIRPDEELDKKTLQKLIQRVGKEINQAGNRVRYTMNTLLISVGGYVPDLTDEAIQISKAIGKVQVDMGGTACKVPYAPDYIQKMLDKGVKKKKMARC